MKKLLILSEKYGIDVRQTVSKVLQALAAKLHIPAEGQFAFGGIIAHNTYITGGLGVGTVNTTAGTVQASGNITSGGLLNVTGAGTSTLTGALSGTYLNLTGTAASSTFSNGLNLSAGCLTYNGSACIGQNGSVTLTQVVASSSPGSNTSFTVPTNTAYIIVETWGSGGGGAGGVGSSADGYNGGGGGGGGYAKKIITAPSGTYYYTVGAGGAGASGGGNGGAGNQSCFGTNSTACTSPTISATGGNAGTNGGASGTGGSGTGGDVNVKGGDGGVGGGYKNATAFMPAGGNGGSAALGGGGGIGGNFTAGGSAGYAFGGGGGGGAASNGAATTGGAGGAGGVTIYVYTTATLTSSGSGVTLTRVVTASAAASNVTYTPPSNISYIEVETWGAGGGGGGNNGTTYGGSGGGGGGYAQKTITAPSGTYYYTVGTGGTAGGNDTTGGTGGRTCFSNSSTSTACSGTTGPIVSATGGSGGPVCNSSGGAGGSGANGDVNMTGGKGANCALLISTAYYIGGAGGDAPRGGAGGTTFHGDASAGQAFGGGGGGAGLNNSVAESSAAGGAGGIVIKEYTTGAATAGSVGSGTAGQFAFYNAAGSNLTATSTLFINTSTGAIGIGSTTPVNALDVNGNINIAAGKCFMVNNVCIGYVKRLAGIYATSTPGTNVAVTLSSAGLAFASGALTIPATTTEMVVETWGSGAGGGGGSTNSNGYPGGGGAGSGGYSRKLITSPSGTYYYTVGAGGAGGAGADPTGSTGSSGNQTCFGTNSTACTSPSAQANGGTGGVGGSYSGGVAVGGLAGAGATAGTGDVTITGATGVSGYTATYGLGATYDVGSNGGTGGSSPGGGGGGKGGGSSGAGTTGSVFGGGGGGGGGANSTGGGAGGAGGVVITVYATSSPTLAGNDYAEMFPVSNPSIGAGDIVAVDVGVPVSMTLATAGSSHALAGVISTQPGQLLGDINAMGQRPVALMGRVPVKVNWEGGAIKIGDRIAVSSVAGVGKKAGIFDPSVGIAIDNYGGDSSPKGGGVSSDTVMVFLDLQSPPTLKMIGEGLLADNTQNSGAFDFVGELLSTIQSRIASAFSGDALATSENAARPGLAAVQNFNTIYNPVPQLTDESASSSLTILTVQASSTRAALLDYLSIVPSLAQGIGELEAQTSFIKNAFGTSTALWIDANGNIGIGTSTPQFTLHVVGSIGADQLCLGGQCVSKWADIASSTSINEITALAGGDSIFHEHGEFDGSRLVTAIIANWDYSSSTPESLVDILKPATGVEPAAHRMTSLEQNQSTGFLSLYHNVVAPSFIATSSVITPQLCLAGDCRTSWPTLVPLSATTSAEELVTARSSAATTTPWAGSYASSSSTLITAINAIGTMIVHVMHDAVYATVGVFDRLLTKELVAENAYTDRMTTKKLCISDENGETCVTRAELDALIAGAGGSTGSPQAGGTGGVSSPGGGGDSSGSGSSGSSGGVSSDSSGSTTTTPTTSATTTTLSDTESPTITINGNNPATINVGDDYADLGATVTDNVDTNLGIHTSVDDTSMEPVAIDTSVAGTHTIEYTATDQAGNTGTTMRTVNVVAPAPTQDTPPNEDTPPSGPAPDPAPAPDTGSATSTTP